MPIRFRCVYCEQLLGIARRKAGTVVKCPNCAGQVIVPSPDGADDDSDPDSPTAAATEKAPAKHLATVPDKTAPAPPPASGDGGMLFERSDFDELLKPVLERQEPAVTSKTARTPRKSTAPAPNAFDFHAGPAAPAATAPPIPVVPAAAPVAPVPTVAPAVSAKPRGGILMTPLKLVLLALFVMAGMAFAFGGGLLLGIAIGKR